jgi:peptidoglycan/LPS O-acetylase OafA/YrhL
MLLSLILMSYTRHNPEGQPWSAALQAFGSKYLPLDGEGGLDRIYGSIGGILLVASIIISPHARFILSQKWLKWLGKVSFAIYLLHGTVLRTVFAWTLSVGHAKQEIIEADPVGVMYAIQRYPVPGVFQCFVATIVCLLVVLTASFLWNIKIEPALGRITKQLEGMVFGRTSGSRQSKEVDDMTGRGSDLLPFTNMRSKSLA